jgi:hypothetical protein
LTGRPDAWLSMAANTSARLHVFLDARLHRRAAVAPLRELLDQPVVEPFRLRQRRDLGCPSRFCCLQISWRINTSMSR